MLEIVSTYITSAILGIMIFFSFVVAPVTFTSLNEENARIFIRKIFPFYYNVNLALSSLVTIIYIFTKSYNLNFYLILIIAILFSASNYILMPLSNLCLFLIRLLFFQLKSLVEKTNLLMLVCIHYQNCF